MNALRLNTRLQGVLLLSNLTELLTLVLIITSRENWKFSTEDTCLVRGLGVSKFPI